jgi:hypothetical protein
MMTPPAIASDRNLTMDNEFINVSRSCHILKTQRLSVGTIRKKQKTLKLSLTILGLYAAKYSPVSLEHSKAK